MPDENSIGELPAALIPSAKSRPRWCSNPCGQKSVPLAVGQGAAGNHSVIAAFSNCLSASANAST